MKVVWSVVALAFCLLAGRAWAAPPSGYPVTITLPTISVAGGLSWSSGSGGNLHQYTLTGASFPAGAVWTWDDGGEGWFDDSGENWVDFRTMTLQCEVPGATMTTLYHGVHSAVADVWTVTATTDFDLVSNQLHLTEPVAVDYVWSKSSPGVTAGVGSFPVPEPQTLLMILAGVPVLFHRQGKQRQRSSANGCLTSCRCS